jgi:uncharacterized HhH-GPD family protein
VISGTREAWARLTRHLLDTDQPSVLLRFTDIERVIGQSLPASKKYAAFWSNTSSYAPAWRDAGYTSSRQGCLPEQIRFVHTSHTPNDGQVAERADIGGAQPRSEESGPQASQADPTRVVVGDVVLVGCVKSKLDRPAAARDLYVSALFAKARDLAERGGQPWFVMSAEHGLVAPQEWLAPYDRYLGDTPESYRRVWGAWVVARLELLTGDLRGRTVEVHAGHTYVDAIRGPLRARGAGLVEPLAGLTMGQRLAWYGTSEPERADAEVSDNAAVPVVRPQDEAPLSFQVVTVHRPGLEAVAAPSEIGPFDYRWPTSTEHFTRGWEATTRDRAGAVRRIRHGLGSREVYGRRREHSVTFLDGQPIVEGVASDDHDDSRGLVSPLKASDRTQIRVPEDVPPQYAGLPLVDHRLEINAKFSRDAVAVKLAEDDVMGWAAYALAREEVRALAGQAPPDRPLPALPPLPVGAQAGSREDVVAAILTFGQSLTTAPDEIPSYTPLPAANQLLLDDSFAFLLGVIFDQNIPAERAWRAPYDLKTRLGHLDPRRIAHDLPAVHQAVGTPPKLHRYVEHLPDWTVAAAARVVSEYGGDAARIWNDEPTARTLIQRLEAFAGIGQKKAAMAVEMLERDLGYTIKDMTGSDIAYDVHVRRVFLRTGLAHTDDPDHMINVARELHPERPGEIDYPVWAIGRRWCHAGIPDCPACPLRAACPKQVNAAGGVTT